jgi:hypothetical protein
MQLSIATVSPSATLVPGKMCLIVVDRLPIVPTESFFPILPVFAKNPVATPARFVKPG